MDQLNSVLDQIANVLLVATQEEMGGDTWDLAFLDVRGSATSQSLSEKYRIKRADGSLINTLDSPDDLMLPLREVFNLRDEVCPDKKWYGLLVTVFPDKKCEVEFNYDPNCKNDKTFYDT